MRATMPVLYAAVVIASLTGASAHAANDPFANDLKVTIALHGMTCDQVVDAKRNADSDYNAVCKDGNRYHVYVDAQGHVVVQKL